jgi:DNA-binding transcriptional LysR family regulator
MEWRLVRFDWNRARAFLVTAEEGSLSAAARALGVAQPTVGRQVSALEQELGVALFERQGRGLELTPSGLELLEHVRSMGAAAAGLSLAATGHSESVEGEVCISSAETTAVFVLPPLLAKLRRIAAGIRIELVASNSETDLKRREADIAIRGYRPVQPELIARKLRDVEGHLYAAPSYLAELGHPMSPGDFGAASFVSFEVLPARMIELLNARGFELTPRNFPISTESSIVQWELVKQGLGVGITAAPIGDAEPCVVRALEDLAPITSELWLVTHRDVRTNRRVRTVFDFLVAELS